MKYLALGNFRICNGILYLDKNEIDSLKEQFLYLSGNYHDLT